MKLSHHPRTVRLALAALVSTTALSGCGVFTNSDEDSEDTLTYWSMWQRGEPQSEVLQAAIDEFEEETGISVDVQWAGREVGQRVRAASNTGDVPDLTDNAVEELLSGSRADVYSGLDSVYERSIPGEDATVAEVIPAHYLDPYQTPDGEPVVAPYTVTTTSLWYDATRLPEIAADPPQTWDEFLETLRQLEADGQTPFAADGTIPDYNAYWLYQLVERQFGPGWFLEAAEDKTGESWSDPTFLEVAKRLETLVSEGYFMEGYQGSKLPAGQQKWAEGEAAFLLMGSWAPADTRDVAPDDAQFRTFAMPMPEGGVNTVEANLIGFGIPSDADNREAAEEFIAFFMNRDRISGISTDAGNLTPRADVEAPPALVDVEAILSGADSTHRYLDGVPTTVEQWYKGVFLPLDDQLFFGKIDAEEFVERLRTESADFWENNG